MPRRVEDIVRNDRPIRRAMPDMRPESERPPVEMRPRSRSVPLHKLRIAPSQPPPLEPRRRRGSFFKGRGFWIIMAAVIIVGVAGAAYAATVYFARATFTLVSVTVPVSANTTFVATGTTTPGYLTYRTLSISGSARTNVPATDGPYTSAKATGRVTLYNGYSAQSQRLIAGTRLSNASGLIYKLTGSVVIPGYTTSASGSKVPGNVSATVVADDAGAQYNMTKNDAIQIFNIVAYQGTPRYTEINAVLSSSISGGFVGQKKTVSPTLLASTTAELQSTLAAKLLAEAKQAVPEGYIMYDSAYKMSYVQPAVSGTSTNSAAVTLSGTLYGVLFRKTDLAAKLAGADKIADFGGFAYSMPGLEDLSFTITNLADFAPARNGTLIARIKGEMKLVGSIPVETMRQKLAGLPLSATRNVLQSYSPVIEVGESSGELFPSWATSVPKDPSRITITIKEE